MVYPAVENMVNVPSTTHASVSLDILGTSAIKHVSTSCFFFFFFFFFKDVISDWNLSQLMAHHK